MKRQTAVLPFFDVDIDRGAFDTREPSIQTYHAIARDLPRRCEVVLDALRAYRREGRPDPTGWELYEWMRARDLAVDINGVRPRLSDLSRLGRIVCTGSRPCAFKHRTADTWKPVE